MSGVDVVTGGAGFIGSHLVEALVSAGRRVRVVDDLATGHRAHLAGVDAEFLEGDAADPALAQRACAGAERVFHLAARPSVPWSIEHPAAARRANLDTTRAMLAAARDAGVLRFVLSSSSAVYGDSPELPKEEAMAPAPRSPYAEHKRAGEEALAAAASEGGLRTVALRYFNVYGPRQDPSSPYSGVISLFARWAAAGETATIHGDGAQTRDFVYVADVVRANLLAAEAALPQPARVYNVASGTAISILDLWEAVCRAAGRAPRPPRLGPRRAGDVRHSHASIARARSELGFVPQVALAEGLRRTVAADRPA